MLSDHLDVDISESVSQSWAAGQEGLEILGVFQIFDQRCIGDHRPDHRGHGGKTVALAILPFKLTKETLHEVIGSLWLNCWNDIQAHEADESNSFGIGFEDR